MQDNNFSNTVQSLFNGMDNIVNSKTVVGDAIQVGDTILLPLVDVSFGLAAGSGSDAECNGKSGGGGAGGMGGKIQPSAVLVLRNGTTKLVNVRNQEGLTKILDMVPDVVNKVTEMVKEKEGHGKETNVTVHDPDCGTVHTENLVFSSTPGPNSNVKKGPNC